MKQSDLCKKENLFNLKDINLGFYVPKIIVKFRQNDTITLAVVKEFKVGTQKSIIGIITKLFERSSLGSNFLRYASTFDTSVLFELERIFFGKAHEIFVKIYDGNQHHGTFST